MGKKRFQDHIVVITGSATGIGEATAYRFADEGAHIIGLDIKDEENQKTIASCKQRGVKAEALHCDVREKKGITKAVQTFQEHWGRINTLVTSAGLYDGAPLEDVSEEAWQEIINTNLTGTFFTCQGFSPFFKNQKYGSIITISSMAGKTSWPASFQYSASKSGVIGLTRSVAMEMAEYGVTANAVCPGNTLTAMVKSVAERVGGPDGMTGKEWLAMRANDCPMKRLAEPWEIAGVITFLASKDAGYVTGQAIEVDGGMVLC